VDDTGVEGASEQREGAIDLHALAGRYDIVGELRGSATTRYFFGRRRENRRDVLISVADGHAHGDNNALAHLASDAQILSSHSHSTVRRVIEGQWIASDAYALVSERPSGSTLHEMLTANGAIPNPRIATLLQQVNAALTWAREHGVVHRGVTPESMYVDPDSDRVQVVMSLTPIPLFGLPDAGADARTIGVLALGMLSGRPHAEDAEALRALARLQSERVVSETEALVNLPAGSEPPDVEEFLSVVAMGDAIRDGELEMAELQATFVEQQRVEATKSEARAREIEAHAMELEERLARERAEFEERRLREEEFLTSARQQFAAERAQFEQERSEFADRVAEFQLRAAIERPADPRTVIPPLASERAEADLIGTGGRFGWLIPVGTVALLVVLIVFGSVFAHHRQPAQTVIFGRTSGTPAAEAPRATIPRGGFLNQSAGNVGLRILPRRADSVTSHVRDSTARRDSIARRDSLRRRDSVPPDTVPRLDTLSR
jgi:hypothetical protein